VVSFRLKHAGYTAAVAAGLLAGAWLPMRTGGTQTARPAQTTAKADVNDVQHVDVSKKQAVAFKVLPAEPRSLRVLKNAV
jgi:cobalt-zinc-cadmium efflux system membrane fusion protein